MRQWLFLAAMLVLEPGCPPTCDRSTCTGCCDVASGECLPGTSRNFCGAGGVGCGRCTSSMRCRAGSCIDTPDAGPVDAGPMVQTCTAGCRDSALECQPGNLPEACGADAGACAQCMPDQRCEFGRCTNAACTGCLEPLGACRPGSETLACGADAGLCLACTTGQFCRNGSCVGSVCSLQTCPTGCCRGDVCVPPAQTSCGVSGVACVTCLSTQMCVNGACR
ncbi:MAG: hypothetical protein Q8N26_04490 [Myxococcales bacterium]|nr:hypothetical protein [Myxococcales bacterium]